MTLETKTVSSGDEQTKVTQNPYGHVIWMAHGDDDWEPVELLHDLLEFVSQFPSEISLRPELKEYANMLLQLLLDVDGDPDEKIELSEGETT